MKLTKDAEFFSFSFLRILCRCTSTVLREMLRLVAISLEESPSFMKLMICISRSVSALMFGESSFSSNEKEDSPNINALTEREMQIINFIKEGLSSKEIATSLNISLKTVEVHRHNILKKLKLKNSASLVNFINTNATYI